MAVGFFAIRVRREFRADELLAAPPVTHPGAPEAYRFAGASDAPPRWPAAS